jgi:hypothetical protein
MELFHHVINNISPSTSGLALLVAVYLYLNTYIPSQGTKLHSCLGKPSTSVCGRCPADDKRSHILYA